MRTFNLFPDDDPGSIIPKHYRRVEIKYSKLGEKRQNFWLENLCLLSYKALVCLMWPISQVINILFDFSFLAESKTLALYVY